MCECVDLWNYPACITSLHTWTGVSFAQLWVAAHTWNLWRILKIIIMHGILHLVQYALELTQHRACSAYMCPRHMIRFSKQKLLVVLLWYFLLHGCCSTKVDFVLTWYLWASFWQFPCSSFLFHYWYDRCMTIWCMSFGLAMGSYNAFTCMQKRPHTWLSKPFFFLF